MHPGAASAARRWPAGALGRGRARRCATRGERVVVTGSAEERELAERGRATAPACRASAVLAGRTDLLGLAALVAGAGACSAATPASPTSRRRSARRPSSLFGPTPPAEWGPPPDRPQHVVLYRGGRGDPHAERPDAGLLAITVEDVLGMTERRFAA